MRTIWLALFLCAVPRLGVCQPAVPLSRADAVATIGWFGAGRSLETRGGPGWSSSLYKSAGGGYYWTDHLKTDGEVAWTGRNRGIYAPAGIPIAGVPFGYAYSVHYFQAFKLSVGQTYQFGRNAWVHPFVTAGIDIDRERHETERPAQTVPVYAGSRVDRTVALPRLAASETAVRAAGFAKAGFKAYASERAFFITDVKAAFRSEIDQWVWRVGFGIDF